MAIDLITDNNNKNNNNISSLASSPRISFSNDLRHKADDPINEDNYSYRSDSNSDFDFCIISSTESATSSADELFSDGLIRPLQLQERFVISKSFSLPRPPPQFQAPLPPLRANQSSNQEEQKHQSKSFWRIKRSCSLHCNDSSHKKSPFWSLPLLSRSNSTGSNSIPKALKEGQKQNQNAKSKLPKKITPSSSTSYYTYPLSQKSPSRKNYGGSHTNGVRISPVLNVPPPCNFKGTANLFGFGSLFRNGKDKKNKK